MSDHSAAPVGRGFGLRAQLLIAFGAIAAMVLVACGVALFAFGQVEQRLEEITRTAQPRMTAARALEATAARLAASAPQLASAPTDTERQRIVSVLAGEIAALRRIVGTLATVAGAEAAAALQEPVDRLSQSVSRLDTVASDRQMLERNRNSAAVELRGLTARIGTVTSPLIATAVQDMLTDGTTLVDTTDDAISALQALVGDGLASVQELRLLVAAMGEAARDYAGGSVAARSDYEAAAARAITILTRLAAVDDTVSAGLRPGVEALVTAGLGPDGALRVPPDAIGVRLNRLVNQRRLVSDQIELSSEDMKSRVELSGTELSQRTRVTIEALLDERLGTLRRLLEFTTALQAYAGALTEAGGAADAARLTEAQQRLAVLGEGLTRGLAALPSALRTGPLAQLTSGLQDLGDQGTGLADLRAQELAKATEASELLARTRTDAEALAAAVASEVSAAEAQAARATENAEAGLDTGRTILTLVAVVAVVLAILIVWLYVGRQIAARMTRLADAMEQVAAGDYAAEVPQGGTGEIAAMARALDHFKQSLVERERLEREHAASEERAEERRRNELRAMASRFEQQVKTVVSTLSTVATRLEGDAETLVDTADITTRQADTVAHAADGTAQNVETGAAAAEELAASIREIGRQVETSSGVARRAVDQVNATNVTVEGLNEAARRIGDVVQLIADIAEQTNLLALNATIEAARAGDAGRGFAVVASEVKSLATQTAKATEDIGHQIRGMQDATQGAVGAIQGISATIREIDEIATTIAAAVEEQQAATAEIARTVQEAARGTAEVTGTISEVRTAAGETRAAADRVVMTAGDVVKQSGTLDREVERFLIQIRSA
ncbi:MAG: methyl-accepting chemotaxis protein [Alphaproteobacteria bacterium]|nr:methyl-accepting chemotaxis protein [Alphaproteobacteria bacterium]